MNQTLRVGVIGAGSSGCGHMFNEEKLKLLRGEDSDVAGSIREGYISAKMCLAAQQSIETGQPVKIEYPDYL